MRGGAVFNRKRLAGLCLTTILCTGLAAPAAAQTARQYRNLDANGVDLTHGDQLIGVSEGSIGAGEAEIELIRRAIGLGSSSAHVGYGPHQWDGIVLQREPVTGGGINTVVIRDGRSEIFPTLGSLPSGSTLAGGGSTYLYRISDGTLITFSDPSGQGEGVSTLCNDDPAQTACVLPATSITTPDGKTVLLEWDLWRACQRPGSPEDPQNCSYWVRLASVSNNSGYRVAFAYASGGSGGFGTTPPPTSWKQRTSASFYNDIVGGGAVASTSYSYPATGVVDVTDTAGRAWRFTGDATKITGIRRPGASTDTTSYAFSGAQVTSVARDGVTTGYARSVSGSTATMAVTNALSQVTTIISDMTIGRPTSVTNALSQTTAYQYDGDARLTQITYPEGNKTVFAYDARGNVTSTTLKAKAGSGLADIVTAANYPSTCSNPLTCNSPEWTKDAKGNQTDYTYDTTHGGVLTVTAPADANGIRPQTRYSYTLTGGVHLLTGTSACMSSASCAGTASEAKTTIGYDGNRLPTTVTASAGDASITLTTTLAYDSRGNVKMVDGPLAGAEDTTTYRYDAGRRLTGIVGPDPDGAGARKRAAQRMTYGNDGLALQELGAVDDASDTAWAAFSSHEQVAITYDANARPVKSELKSGGTTYAVSQTSYDGLGRIDCSVQRMNSAAFGSLPGACSLGTAGSDGPDRIAKTSYDAAGRVTKTQTAYGTAAQADEVTTAYTNNGQVAYAIDAESNRTGYTYDGHDRLVKTEYPSTTKGANSVNPSDYEQLTYDANGNVTNRRLRDGTSIGYGYDNLDRTVSKDLPASETDVTYSYDLLNRPTGAIQGSQTLTFAYDALGRKTSEAASYLGTVSYGYDAAGRRTSMIYPGSGLTINYDHDVTGNVTAIRENGATSGVGVLAAYAFDNLGRRTSVTFGNGSVQSFGYDAVSRLSSLTNDLGGGATTHDLAQTFSHNPASQIASVTRSNDAYAWQAHYNVDRAYVADGLNRIMSAGGLGLGYDARGNLTSSGANSYGYSSENLLTHAGGALRYVYDPIGRLKANNNINWFVYDGANLIAEVDPAGTTTQRYVHGPGIDNPIVWYEGSAINGTTRRFLMADERGSIVSVTDSAGATINVNSYDEYGIPAPGNIGRFGYTGQTWLPEVGLWYYKARMYSPTLGRFMQTDPIGYTDGMNWYNYVGSDPVNFVDPMGLQTCFPVEEKLSFPQADFTVAGKIATFQLCLRSHVAPGGGGGGPGGTGGSGSSPQNICPPVSADRSVGFVGEWGAAIMDPFNAFSAKDAARRANEASMARFPNMMGGDDLKDAYRHFYWVATMTREIGYRSAISFANAHEVTASGIPASQNMDTYNNWTAAKMALDPRFKSKSISELAETAIDNNCLKVLK